MMNSVVRTSAAVAVIAIVAMSLSACALFAGTPRDASGQVTVSTEIRSTDLLIDDCFSYLGDGTNLSQVTVIPCADAHTHRVIGQGTLSVTQLADAGGIQNAISEACNQSFADFAASLAEGLTTEQQFLVSAITVDGVESQFYSCVALDPETPSAG